MALAWALAWAKPRILAAVAIAILLSACRFEANLDISPDGSGTGSLVLFDPPPAITVQDMARQLERAGFATSAIESPTPNRYQCRIAWKEFKPALGRRVVSPDGAVTLDFGPIDQGRLIVHVPGRIDAADTTGVVSGASTVLFTRGRAHLTYAAAGMGPFIALAIGTCLLALAVVGAVVIQRRQRHAAAASLASNA